MKKKLLLVSFLIGLLVSFIPQESRCQSNVDPTVTGLPSFIAVQEDAITDEFNISAATISDVDAGSGALTLTLIATGGIFDIAAGTGIILSGHLTDRLTLSGNLTDLNNYIAIPSNIYFRPTPNLSGVGAAEVKVFINDNGHTGTGGGNDISLGIIQINITPVNDAPTDITLSNSSVNQSAGVNAEVGLLSTADPDVGDTHAYSLVAGAGSTHNASFNISGNTLRANDASALAAGTYNLRIRTVDGHGETFEKALTITVVGDTNVITPGDPGNFITMWKTDNPGETGDTQIRIPTIGGGYDYTIYWADVNDAAVHGVETGITGTHTLTFPTAGTYRVEITGDFPRISFGTVAVGGDMEKILSIEQWGDIQWTSMNRAFSRAANLQSNATDAPDLSSVTDLEYMFVGALAFNGDISGWDVSNITNMTGMFSSAIAFNSDISGWDVSSVTDMFSMFNNATAFNGDIAGWDVSNVTDMSAMFLGATAFDQSLAGWDISSVTNMSNMLSGSGLSLENYDALLIGWAALSGLQNNVQLGAFGLEYCAGAEARQSLMDDHGWTITGDAGCDTQRPFVTSWQTTTANESITIPVNPNVSGYNYSVDWGDGTTSTGQTGNAVHSYAEAGTYTVSISGDFPAIQLGSVASDNTNDQKLRSIEQWGDIAWTTMEGAFANASNLRSTAVDVPDLSGVSSLAWMFAGARSFNADLSGWDVSSVTNMDAMFEEASAFNGNISGWNVSNVTNMRRLFFHASVFNQNIGSWDVSKVTNMQALFEGAAAFNQDIGDWDVSRVTAMNWMFQDAFAFNQDIGDWDVSSVTNMSAMFARTASFDNDISGWDVSNVRDMSWMFAESKAFNQALGNWDVSNVTNMIGMFNDTQAFNGDIAGWAFPNASSLRWVFRNAVAFNRDLSSWDVSHVTNMESTFSGATSFNRDLGNWAISQVTNMHNMLANSGLSLENYDATLIGWAALPGLQNSIRLGAMGLEYCAGAEARQSLIDDHSWTVEGDTPACASMVIFVRTESGRTLIIHAEGSDAIQQVKQRIQDQIGVPPHLQRLLFDGAALEDGRTLAEYNIQNGSMLDLRVNIAPTVTHPIPDQETIQNTPFSFQFPEDTFEDTDQDDVLTYTAELSNGESLPDWLDFDEDTRTFSGTPGNTDVGTIEIAVTADDGNGGTVADIFTLTVTPRPSVTVGTTVSSPVNAPFMVSVVFSEAVTGFTTGNITATNATLSNLMTSDDVSYTVLVSPAVGGTVQVSVPADAVTNTSGNGNTASNVLEVQYNMPVAGVSIEDKSVVYDGTIKSLAITGDLPEGASVSYTIDGEPGNGATDAGEYEVTATVSGDNYETLELTAALTITPLAITVAADDQTKIFGSDDPELTYGVDPALVAGDAFAGSLARTAGEDVGSYAITQGNLSLSDNYAITFTGAELTIAPATITGIAIADAIFTYSGTDHTLAITGDLPEGASVSYTIEGEPGNGATDAGIYEVTATVSGDNYETLELTATLTITPLVITVAADDQTKIFGSADPELTYRVDPALVAGDAFTGSLARTAGEDVGSYAITQGNLSLSDNYAITFTGAEFSIAPATITGITFEDASFTYSGTDHTLAITGDLPEGASVSYTIDGEPGNGATDAGEYEVTATVSGDNYETLELTATLTITPLAITVAADDQTKIFGSDDPELTYRVDPALVAGNAFTGSLARTAGEDAGSYAITQGDLSAGGNYVITFIGADFIIAPPELPADITGISLNNGTFLYNGAVHRLVITGELPAGVSVSYINNGRTDVGSQTVTATMAGAGYQTLVLTAILEVTPAPRTITFAPLAEKTYGDADFAAGATASSGEDILYTSSNPLVAEVTADGRIAVHGAGTTTITATVPENGNYSNRPEVSRVLTVHKAPQSITFNAPTTVNRDAGSTQLDVSAGSRLPVSLVIDDEQVATVEGTVLHIHRLGTVRITATQAGDGNHEPAAPVTVTVRVVDPSSDLPVLVHPVISPNGDGINEFLMIEAIQDYPENRVTIFNRNGTLLWEANGYDNNRVAFRGIGTGQLPLPAGTYFYIVEVKENGMWKYKKGYFVLRY
ncbi:BspA family leucine-rich repeat surface protein [Parapedobacter deserti]|uniref:BspA family leucine-rich repeat surface protein n=1 Tax=Parapedobacter deserti TaxID=1912957 RepID=A0ABV7JGH8_9SPHI